VIARLPFVGPGNAWTAGREALVVCPIRLVATGCDRSYVVAEAAQPIDGERLRGALTAQRLELVMATPWSKLEASGRYAALIEVDGFVALTDDARLAPFAEPTSDQPLVLTPIGGYALPLTAAELLSDVRSSAAGGTAAVNCGE
jgi:hypothetical protein